MIRLKIRQLCCFSEYYFLVVIILSAVVFSYPPYAVAEDSSNWELMPRNGNNQNLVCDDCECPPTPDGYRLASGCAGLEGGGCEDCTPSDDDPPGTVYAECIFIKLSGPDGGGSGEVQSLPCLLAGSTPTPSPTPTPTPVPDPKNCRWSCPMSGTGLIDGCAGEKRCNDVTPACRIEINGVIKKARRCDGPTQSD